MPVLAPTIFGDLRSRGGQLALWSDTESVSYGELADRVDAARAQLGNERRLVTLAPDNSVHSIVWLLAALTDAHPLALTAGRPSPEFLAAHDPDVVIVGNSLAEIRTRSHHELHPDLAVLLSTSGSTGSPKLVRLSRRNVVSNARAIAEYLVLGSSDRALTTLPMHYSYGLSVITSHLLAGASLALTNDSVSDPCLWEFARGVGATSFAGVPYSFEMLDTVGLPQLPTLRQVTAAGGSLGTEGVRRWARLGRERGFEFVAMYGQTEATARMAYLPPHLAESHPHALGVAIPGGELRLEPLDGDVSEIVYRGDNVMMGYAESASDLARGAELTELRTGDLGRVGTDGMLVWCGRQGRTAKLFGLRIDLDHLESQLPGCAIEARDGRLHALTDASWSATDIAGRAGLPEHAVSLTSVEALPRTGNGKLDRRTVAEHLRGRDSGERPADVRELFAGLLGRPDASDQDTFVTLGGDSLSYVELSLRLGELGIDLPMGWQHTPICELAARASGRQELETSIALRALAITEVVGAHSGVWTVPGGSHVLLVLVGFNLARFRAGRFGPDTRRLVRIAIPCLAVMGTMALLYGESMTTIVRTAFWPGDATIGWRGWWFVQTALIAQIAVLVLGLIPHLKRAIERGSQWFAWVTLAMLVAVRFALPGTDVTVMERHATPVVLWEVALGWAIATCRSTRQRVVLSAVALGSFADFFSIKHTAAVLVIASILTLIWVPTVPIRGILARVCATVASASLVIFLTHWEVFRYFLHTAPVMGLLSSIVVGVVLWRAAEASDRAIRQALARSRAR